MTNSLYRLLAGVARMPSEIERRQIGLPVRGRLGRYAFLHDEVDGAVAVADRLKALAAKSTYWK